MFDLITIGDCVVDTLIPLLDAHVEIENGESRICLPFGAKVPVGSATSLVAGNATNNAVGAARLNMKVAIYTNVGDDSDDQRIKSKLRKEGVDIRYVIENKGLPSNHNIVLHYKGERTILVHHQPWKFSLPDLDKAKWIYLTSLSATFVESHLIDQLVNYLERCGGRLVYQPGTFQIKAGIKKYPRLLSLTELFIVNKDEAKKILGYDTEDSVTVKKLLKEVLDLGPQKVIITDGAKGSYGTDGNRYYKLDVFPAKLVEMTGSGDAYASGVLAGLFYGKELPEAMCWGAANGAAVVEEIGPQAGLLTYYQMQKKLKENGKIKEEEI